MSRMRRASVDTIERFVKDVTASKADHVRDRRLSLTMMNCIWARNTDDETEVPVQGEVTGNVPEWLEGSLYRVGPGIFQKGTYCYNHPFDMTSVLHKYSLNPRDNEYLYKNKIVHTKSSKLGLRGGLLNLNTGSGPLGEDMFDEEGGTIPKSDLKGLRGKPNMDPFKSKLNRFTSLFHRSNSTSSASTSLPTLLTRRELKDTCMDSVCFFGEEMYLLSDNSLMLRVDPESLQTTSQHSIDDHAPVFLATSHPQVEEDGTVWNIGTAHHKKSGFVYSVFKFDPKTSEEEIENDELGTGKVIATIPSRDKNSPCYYHSFGITQDYIVFIEQPLFVEGQSNGIRSACAGGSSKADGSGSNGNPSGEETYEQGAIYHRLKWRRNEMVHFHVVNRHTGEVFPKTYVSNPFFFFHTINAFQKGSTIIIDLVIYKDADILSDLKFSHIEKTDRVPSANAMRIVLPTENVQGMGRSSELVTVKPEALVPEHLEFPRFNYKLVGQKNQFFYALGNDYLHPNRIYKVDTESRDVFVWKDPGHFVSEPVFVARPGGKREDEGAVLFTLLSAAKHNSVQVVILDAETFSEMARIRFFAEGTVTEGFHGIFVPSGMEGRPKRF